MSSVSNLRSSDEHAIFEEVVAKNFPELEKDTYLHIENVLNSESSATQMERNGHIVRVGGVALSVCYARSLPLFLHS